MRADWATSMYAVRVSLAIRTLAIGFGVVCAATVLTARQPGRGTVWDGVYTAEQAARGRAVYEEHCSSCHLPDLSGSGEARSLVGDAFMDDWREDTLGTLFSRTRTMMPFDNPATLADGDYLDSIAYILQVNRFPEGRRALTAGELDDIRIENEEGPGEVPSFALVRVMGCLVRETDGGWLLTHATVARRTQDPAVSDPDELTALDRQAPGLRTFALISPYPDPTPHSGHRMEAKGLLIRDADGDRINVSSLGMVAVACGSR